jgi:hypothetical protein
VPGIPDLTSVVPSERLPEGLGPDDEPDNIGRAIRGAEEWMRAFKWCQDIKRAFWGFGFPPMVAVCLFEIEPSTPEVDSWLWTVTGDLPPAYLVTDDAPNPEAALRAYVAEMRRWISAVRSGDDLAGVIPVNAEPTEHWAGELASRLDFIEQEVLGGTESRNDC